MEDFYYTNHCVQLGDCKYPGHKKELRWGQVLIQKSHSLNSFLRAGNLQLHQWITIPVCFYLYFVSYLRFQTVLIIIPRECGIDVRSGDLSQKQRSTGSHRTSVSRFWESSSNIESFFTRLQQLHNTSLCLTRSAQLPHPARVSCSDLFTHGWIQQNEERGSGI